MKTLIISLALVFISCKGNDLKTEITQKHRNKIVNVKNKIVDIKTDRIFGNALLYIVDNILIVHEIAPKGEKGIHLFNKNTFQYLTSTGFSGRGPGEIIIPGCVGIERSKKVFWVLDHGNSVLWKFPLDSVLSNADFHPKEKIDLNSELFIDRFDFLNDSIILGKSVQMISPSGFKKVMTKLDLKRNQLNVFGYENPKTESKYSYSEFALSPVGNFYVNCYYYCDLITICDLEGNLRRNIYGPEKAFNNEFKKCYFFGVDLYKDKIITSYIGDKALTNDGNRPVGNTPSKFILFDSNGNYLKTLETGYKFTYFCVDEENNRIIVYFSTRKEPLGYFSLN